MQRRQFVKSTCTFCLLAAAGASIPSLLLAGEKSKLYKTAVNDEGYAEVPLTLFDTTDLQIVRVKRTYYDIAVQKEADGMYTALLLRCTHMDNQLSPIGSGYRCNLHGSEYDKEGNVTKGPSEMPLVKYKTTTNETSLFIKIPENQ